MKVKDEMLTQTEKQLIKTELQKPEYAGLSVTEKARMLTQRPMVPNVDTDGDSIPVPQVPEPFSALDIFSLVDAARRGSIAKLPLVVAIQNDIERQSRTGLANWALLLKDSNEIIDDEYDAIIARLQTTIADPNHPGEIMGDNKLTEILGRTLGGISIKTIAELDD